MVCSQERVGGEGSFDAKNGCQLACAAPHGVPSDGGVASRLVGAA